MEPLTPDRSFLTGLRLGGPSDAKTLPNGRILRLTVGRVHRGRVFLSGDGVTLSARNSAGLRRGEHVVVRVVRRGSSLTLTVTQRSGATENAAGASLYDRFLATHGVSDGSLSRSVFSSLIRSHRRIEPRIFRLTRDRLHRSGERSSPTVRGVLELTDREIEVETIDERSRQEVFAWFSGGGQSNTKEDRNGTHRESRSLDSSIRSLKAYLTRATENPTHPLQLYNHLKPGTGDEHWIVVPIGAASGDREVRSVLKVKWDIVAGSPREALLSVDRDGGRWWFRWYIRHGEAVFDRSWIEGDGDEPPPSLLANLGGTRHTDNVYRGDGFSPDWDTEDDQSVDTYG